MDNRPTPDIISFACEQCGREFKVGVEFAGRATRCPRCQQALIVPMPTADVTVTLKATSSGVGIPLAQAPVTVASGGTSTDSEAASVRAAPALPTTPRRYAVGAEIARGGMGSIVQALDQDIRREVAIKYLLDQSDARKQMRFVEEAQITGQLEHPNIVPIHELGLDSQQRLFFSMKMVKGRSLSHVLAGLKNQAADKEYNLARLLDVFVAICNALAYAHARGVVHRDLKPDNIMIGDFGEVYVMDWGLAKVLRGSGPAVEQPLVVGRPAVATLVLPGGVDATPVADVPAPTVIMPMTDRVSTSRQQEEQLTQDGAIVGTPVYMPPEQATGKIQAIDERSDIYALGAILYEMLALVPPVEMGGGALAVLLRVTNGEIIPPAQRAPERARAGHIPPQLAAIALKALARHPDDRYQSVEFLRRDIQRFLDGRSVSAKDDTFAEVLVRFVKRNRATSAVSAAAALILAVVVTSSLVVNLRARHEAETAYEAFALAQKDKEARTRQAVPALVKVARLEIEQRRFDEALKDINLALEYDPAHVDGRLLRAQLHAARQEFVAASADLEKYLSSRPKDGLARELKRHCDEVRPEDDDKTRLVQLGQALVWQDHPELAEVLLQRHGESGDAVRQQLLKLYRTRINAAFRNQGDLLSLDGHGFRLKLKGIEARDLRALQGMALNALEIDSAPELCDLAALQAMPLRALTLVRCKAADLAGLKGLPLTSLTLKDCNLADLGSLSGMPLSELVLERSIGARISDVGPLQGMPLRTLRLIHAANLHDLSGLEGMPLETLVISGCGQVRDLTPLRGMPLTSLNLSGCSILQDLAPLRGLTLEHLDLSSCTEVRDISVLRGMPLVRLSLRRCPLLKELGPLAGLPLRSLELGACSQVEDLTPLAGMHLTMLDLGATSVKSLAPLKGMPLISIILAGCPALADLSALQGMPLTELDLSGCKALSDLAPLRRMPLHALTLSGCTEVADLSPLDGMRLNAILLKGCAKINDLTPLRQSVLTRIELAGCSALRDLNGLQGMRFTRLDLVGCAGLTALHGLEDCTLATLSIENCGMLEGLAGLAGLPLQKIEVKSCPRLRDLSGLAGLGLKELRLERCPQVRELTPLAGLRLTTLEISGCEQVASLAALKGMPLVRLALTDCPKVTDLGPLKGSKVAELNLSGCPGLTSLAALQGMYLRQLNIGGSGVKDLASLKGMPTLRSLKMDRCLQLTDLSPLAGLRLEEVQLPPRVTTGLAALRNMPNLQTIDGMPAAFYWLQTEDAGRRAEMR